MHKQAGTRAGNHQRHIRTINVSPAMQAGNNTYVRYDASGNTTYVLSSLILLVHLFFSQELSLCFSFSVETLKTGIKVLGETFVMVKRHKEGHQCEQISQEHQNPSTTTAAVQHSQRHTTSIQSRRHTTKGGPQEYSARAATNRQVKETATDPTREPPPPAHTQFVPAGVSC